MKTIVFDVDGVLANFTKPFTTIGNELFGTPIVDCCEQPSWDFNEILTRVQQSRVWIVVRRTPEWWTSLPPLVSSDIFHQIESLTAFNEVYFLTNRLSDMRPSGEQTLTWLKCRGISDPRVIVSSRKGEITSALKADFAIEDNWSNACAIHWMAEGCRTFLIKRGYNEKAREIIPKGITVVNSVGEFLNQIGG